MRIVRFGRAVWILAFLGAVGITSSAVHDEGEDAGLTAAVVALAASITMLTLAAGMAVGFVVWCLRFMHWPLTVRALSSAISPAHPVLPTPRHPEADADATTTLSRYCILTIVGDTLLGAGLTDGDQVQVDRWAHPVGGTLVAARHEEVGNRPACYVVGMLHRTGDGRAVLLAPPGGPLAGQLLCGCGHLVLLGPVVAMAKPGFTPP